MIFFSKKFVAALLSSVMILSAEGLSQKEIDCDNTLNTCIEKCDASENVDESCSQKCEDAYDQCMPTVDSEDMPEEDMPKES